MQTYLFIFGTLGLTVFGQLMIKWRALAHTGAPPIGTGRSAGSLGYLVAMFTDAGVWCGLVGAVIASVCWTLAVRQAPLSLAYPFMALSFVLVPAAAAALFGETISLGQVLGLALVVGGVVLNATWR